MFSKLPVLWDRQRDLLGRAHIVLCSLDNMCLNSRVQPKTQTQN